MDIAICPTPALLNKPLAVVGCRGGSLQYSAQLLCLHGGGMGIVSLFCVLKAMPPKPSESHNIHGQRRANTQREICLE